MTNSERGHRLRVFRALQQFMDAHHRSPTIKECARSAGLTYYTARKHMVALDGAKGLPYPVEFSKSFGRYVDRQTNGTPAMQYANRRGGDGGRGRLDPYTASVDKLMGAS